MIVWLERAAVVAIHDRQVAEHGGGSGVRDENLLQSALARPQQLAAYSDDTPDVCELAASMAFGLARNHPFVDGNKRTAWVCCRTFLLLNDCDFSADIDDKYVTILALAEGLLSENDFATWLRQHSKSTVESIQESEAEYR